MPGARRQNTVTMTFNPVIVNETMNSAIDSSQTDWPRPEPGTAWGNALRGG